MIQSSTLAKGVALTLSATLIIGGMFLARPDAPIEMAGGGEPVEARMGTAFEDMAVGTLTAQTAEDTTQPPKPPVETARPTQPLETPRTEVPPHAIAPRPTDAVPTAQAIAPVPLPDAVLPDTARPIETPIGPVQPQETIASESPDSTAPQLSMRPQRRDPEKAAKIAAARPKPTPERQPEPRSQRGTALRNNTQGTDAGSSRQAKAKAQGSARQAATQSGNAAASNYPGQVMRKISRVRRPNVRARGTATISFRIAASGGLAGISVARSSGSAALDQAALRVVQTAAPFPSPPSGAGRNFSIQIQGR